MQDLHEKFGFFRALWVKIIIIIIYLAYNGCSEARKYINNFIKAQLQNFRNFRKLDENLLQICANTREQTEFSIVYGGSRSEAPEARIF